MLKIPLLNFLFFALHLVAALGFTLHRQYQLAFHPVAMVLLYIGIILIEKNTRYKLQYHLRVLVLLTFTGHGVVGKYFAAYNNLQYYDTFLHVFGTFSLTLFTYSLIITFISIQTSHPFIFTILFVLLLGISQGTIFELIEFGFDILRVDQNQRGLVDTNIDIIADIIGAAAAGLFLAKKNPLKRKSS